MANIIWNPGINGTNPTVELIVNQQSQSVDGNYTVLAYSLILHRPMNVSSSASKSYNVKINNVTVASGSTTIGGSGDKTIASGTTTVYHNADGTIGGIPLSFYLDIGITWSGSGTGNASGSGTIYPTTIPRATQPTLSAGSVQIGSALTINTPRASGSFTHKLFYKWATGGWIPITPNNIETSYAWTTPTSLSSGLPNSTSGTITIAVDTYNGATFIGTKTVELTITVPASVVPTASVATSGVDLYSGKYVQGRSKVTVTLTDSGAEGSQIVARSITVRSGANVIATSSASSFTTGVLTYSGTITIETSSTDSRGKTVTKSTTITVVAYEAPKVVTFNAFRCNSDGTANDKGAHMKIQGSSLISSIGNTNTKSTILRYRVKGTTTWSNAMTDGGSYSPVLSAVVPADENTSFEVQIYVGDYFDSTSSTMNVGTAFTLINFHTDGRSFAIGKVAEGNGILEIDGDLYVNGKVIGDLKVKDVRNTNPTPDDLKDSAISTFFNNMYGDSWRSGISVKGWTDGYQAWQLSAPSNSALNEKLSFRVGLNGTWQTWRDIWHSGNFNPASYSLTSHTHGNYIGVTQGIEVSGSNANGSYIKFGDGTLLCWGTNVQKNATPNNVWGSIYYSQYLSFTFPITFVGLPNVQAQNTNSIAEGWFVVTGATATGFSGYVMRPAVGINGTYATYWTAIGRWK